VTQPSSVSLIEIARGLAPPGTPTRTITRWVRQAKQAATSGGLPPTAATIAEELAKIIPAQVPPDDDR